MTTAGEFCNRWVVFIEPSESALDAARRMRHHHVGALVVVEQRDRGRVPVGMITDRDLTMQLVAETVQNPAAVPVRALLQRKLVVANEADNMVDVVERMRAFGIRRIPVVDARGTLQGLIAFDDFVGFVADQLEALAQLIGREQHHERYGSALGQMDAGGSVARPGPPFLDGWR